MEVIKILLEFEGWDPNGSKKTLKKSIQIFTLKPHSQPGLWEDLAYFQSFIEVIIRELFKERNS